MPFNRNRICGCPAVTPISVLLAQYRAILDAELGRDATWVEAAMRAHMAEVGRFAGGLPAHRPALF